MVRSEPSNTIILQTIRLLLVLECWISDGNFITFLSDLLFRRLKNLNILEIVLQEKIECVHQKNIFCWLQYELTPYLKGSKGRESRSTVCVGSVSNATHLKKQIS